MSFLEILGFFDKHNILSTVSVIGGYSPTMFCAVFSINHIFQQILDLSVTHFPICLVKFTIHYFAPSLNELQLKLNFTSYLKRKWGLNGRRQRISKVFFAPFQCIEYFTVLFQRTRTRLWSVMCTRVPLELLHCNSLWRITSIIDKVKQSRPSPSLFSFFLVLYTLLTIE